MTQYIVISLDFELKWGMLDLLWETPDTYKEPLDSVPEIVPATLELFAKHKVEATWAVVGALACENWDEYEARAPRWPAYQQEQLRAPARGLTKQPYPQHFFAPDLVDSIARAPGQELGYHTFAHAYMAEPGYTVEDAQADFTAMEHLFTDKWNRPAASFVFPRNQVTWESVLRQHGIKVWRSNPTPFFWHLTRAQDLSKLARILRLLDSLAPMGTRRVPAVRHVHRASHFIRFTLPDSLWQAHIKRLQNDAKGLAEGEMLHLWWHPHNMAVNPQRSVRRLDELLDRLSSSSPANTRFVPMGHFAGAEPSTC